MRNIAFGFFVAAALVYSSAAQTSTDPFFDTITVTAPDPNAAEAGPDRGLFEIRRTGPTNFGVTVFYRLSGSASNGVDYETISSTVMIPAGSSSASIPVKPIADDAIEGPETVVLQISPSLLMCPGPSCSYYIGWPSNATVTIADSQTPPPTNHPPFVQLNSPRNGEQFIAPAQILLRAYVQDAEDGYDLTVEFFEGKNSLGFGTFVGARCATPYCPYYELTWSNVPPGNYAITAKATDRAGASSLSDPAHVAVLGGVNIFATDPNATEQSPLVAAAPDTATFTVRRSGDTSESIVVYYEISGTASNGEDYDKLSGEVAVPAGAASADIVVSAIDDNLIEGTETVELALIAPCPPCLFTNPQCEVPQGTNCYPLGPHTRAAANIHDNDRPPSTNPPVLTIVARDAIAVEGDFSGSNWWWTSSTSDGRWTTNSQPSSATPRNNTAAFEVRRSGGTNSDLTVYYLIGGTASNGVDYVNLANHIIIPAGRYAARIEVVPIDDKLPEPIESVVLTLTAPASTTPYQLGYPRKAAAVIVDNDQPRPHCDRLSDGLFHLCAPGTNGFAYCIRTSSDLVTWTSQCTNVVTDGAVHFIDPDAPDMKHRFYQVIPQTAYSLPP